MQQKNRKENNVPKPVHHGEDSGAGGGNLDNLRRDGERFIAAGNETINRILSGDSEKFLSQSRQAGGQ